jgi:cytoskeleton protein RodZ
MLQEMVAQRMERGISLAQISEETKIGRRYLEAIELGRFHVLPGGVYNVSYIRQYARAAQLNEEELVAYYRRLYTSTRPLTGT